jgi:hypothetical protein
VIIFSDLKATKTMNSELSKTISTSVIWLAMACILTFGVFKLNLDGFLTAFLIMFCLPCAMVYGAVEATKIIWRSASEQEKRADSETALSPMQPISSAPKS